MHQSGRIYEWLVTHVWTCDLAHLNGSCCTCECVVLQCVAAYCSVLQCVAVFHKYCVVSRRRSDCVTMYKSSLTYEWVISHVCMSHPYEWIMRVSESNEWRSRTCEWVTRMIESCHKQLTRFHVTHTNESWHIHEGITSHIWMGHVTNMNVSCHSSCHVTRRVTYKYRQQQKRHVSHTNEWSPKYHWILYKHGWVVSQIWIRHITCWVAQEERSRHHNGRERVVTKEVPVDRVVYKEVRACMRACMWTCVRACTRACVHPCVHESLLNMYIFTYIYRCRYIYYTCMYIYIRVHTCACVCIYIYKYI